MSVPIPPCPCGEAEQWKPIPEWERHYQASDHGRIRSITRITTYIDGRRRTRQGTLLAGSADSTGRQRVVLAGDGRRQTRTVSTLILEAFVGPRPGSDYECCHGDGCPGNDHLSNLRWGSRADNREDMRRHRTHRHVQRTHCPYGHRLGVPNVTPGRASRGWRSCLACARARNNVHYAKLTGRSHDFLTWADDHYARIMAGAS